MTRFARAKGSKSSNERLPHEATPWHVMKEQLEIATSKEEKEPKTKTKSAKELIKEKDDVYYAKSLGNIKTDWAEFENSSNKQNVKNGKIEKKKKSKDKHLNRVLENVAIDKNENFKQVKSNKFQKREIISSEPKVDNSITDSNVNKCEDEKKKKKGKRKCMNEEKANIIPDSSETKSEEKQHNSDAPTNKLSKRQKRNQKKTTQNSENNKSNSTFNTEGNDWNHSVNTNNKREFDRTNNFNDRRKQWSKLDLDQKNFYRFGDNVPKKFKKKVAKPRDNKEHVRRKQDTSSVKVTINGMDVEIVKYDGFPIKKDDAERLTALRKEMVMKGIPKSEIDAAMKLERRKCEKALARIRKQICFHCRKAGHNLSDCPELGKEEAGTGICFKCGSTEHTHFECKVNKSDDYRYAKCFICREQGHIAKQCPDNPKGLYPDGGSCKICGEVTHLKKDCPDLVKEKEETAITLDTIKDDNLESLDNEVKNRKTEIKSSKKVVKF